ncbi:hypothetical protein [Paraburkholderia fungorum]|uniref:hypothetical protein n=1 Tax=Paraburkholderia fungorum TaxID=134537 RepID=UPI0038BB17EE
MTENSVLGNANDSTLDQNIDALPSSAKAQRPPLIQERACWSWSSGHFDWMDNSRPFVLTDTASY